MSVLLKIKRIRAAFFLLLVVVSGIFVGQSRAQNASYSVNGLYGFYVENAGDSLHAHWITAKGDAGFLEAASDNKTYFSGKTALGRVHTLTFPKNSASQIDLRFGAVNDQSDRHAVSIDFDRIENRPHARHSKADSVFVLGDVHGRFDQLTQLLKNAKVIDENLNWSAGRAHLVFLGDLFDRGHDVTRLLWFIYQLEQQALKHRGFVHVVLGNHEIMTFVDDLRYLSEKEKLISTFLGVGYAKMYHPQTSLLGSWLASKPGIARINDVLYAHGGVTPNYAKWSIPTYNDSLFAFIKEPVFFDLLGDSTVTAKYEETYFTDRLNFFFAPVSPYWFRGYVNSDTLDKHLDFVLKKFKAKTHVVAHTPVDSIRAFYGDKIIAVDLLDAATEMLLLVRRKKKTHRFRYTISGQIHPLGEGFIKK